MYFTELGPKYDSSEGGPKKESLVSMALPLNRNCPHNIGKGAKGYHHTMARDWKRERSWLI